MRNPLAAFPLLLALAAIAAPAPGGAQDPAVPAAPPPAQEWERLVPPSSDFFNLSWDRASVAREGELVRVAVRAVADIGRRPRQGDFLYEFRCRDSEFRVIRTTNYTPAGEPLVENTPRNRFAKIKRGTYMETIRAAVC